MTRTLATMLLCSVLAPVLGFAADGEVRVPRDVARVSVPPPFARTCQVVFDGHRTVDAACPSPVYEEQWEGPVLLATNTSARTIWVSYIYSDIDGRTYHGPCYELPSESTRAIPDQAILPLGQREAHVTLLPGPGYPRNGFQLTCGSQRKVVETP